MPFHANPTSMQAGTNTFFKYTSVASTNKLTANTLIKHFINNAGKQKTHKVFIYYVLSSLHFTVRQPRFNLVIKNILK